MLYHMCFLVDGLDEGGHGLLVALGAAALEVLLYNESPTSDETRYDIFFCGLGLTSFEKGTSYPLLSKSAAAALSLLLLVYYYKY